MGASRSQVASNPETGGSSLIRVRNQVVLPAPLRPTTAQS